MLYYLGIAAFELVLYFLYNTAVPKYKKWIFILGCVGLWLFVGLRSDTTGVDTIGYMRRFQNIAETAWEDIPLTTDRDYGFYYFTKLIRCITDSNIAFKLITAFVSLIGVFDLCWHNTKKPLLALYFYITIGNLFFILTGMRQAMAMSICLLSVKFIQKRKIIPFAILVVLAAQLHHSAYIFLPMYFLGVRRVDTKNMLITIAVTLLAYFSYENLLMVANDILDYNYGVEKIDNGGIFFAILLIILTLALVTKSRWMKEVKERVVMNAGIICGVVWVFRLVGRTAERPSMYFLNAIPVVFSEAIDSVENKENRVFVEFGAIVLTFAFFAYRVAGQYYAFGF